jgi:UDPglucose--hexose-1-phosphate uridylyltransferase
VVPNLYPALERQEVVVHTPRHARSLAELEEGEVEAVAAALHARREAARAEGFAYVQIVLNEGRAAGSSLPHSHSQLFWLREAPPAVLEELPRLEPGSCGVCAALREESLEIALRGETVMLAAPAGRAPYELLIAPREHAAEPTEQNFVDAALLLRDAIRRIRGVEGPAPLNAWLHTGGHWHLELVPRLTVFAGLELGAEIYVNSLPPDEAAARLRATSD